MSAAYNTTMLSLRFVRAAIVSRQSSVIVDVTSLRANTRYSPSSSETMVSRLPSASLFSWPLTWRRSFCCSTDSDSLLLTWCRSAGGTYLDLVLACEDAARTFFGRSSKWLFTCSSSARMSSFSISSSSASSTFSSSSSSSLSPVISSSFSASLSSSTLASESSPARSAWSSSSSSYMPG